MSIVVASAIKTILLGAWRTKATCEEWENRIREVLPRGVNGDVYDLADCLLKQALIGPVPNRLFIAYLKHAVNNGLVSHGAVLSSISQQTVSLSKQAPVNASNQNVLTRASSVVCILDFLKSFRDSISCNGTELECLNLCHSISQLVYWLLNCIQTSIEMLIHESCQSQAQPQTTPQQQQQQQQQQPLHQQQQSQHPNLQPASGNMAFSTTMNQHVNNLVINMAHFESNAAIMELCTEMLQHFLNRPFTKSLLYISKIEYPQEFDKILLTGQTIVQRINTSSLQFIPEKIKNFDVVQKFGLVFNSSDLHPSVVAAQQLRYLQLHRIRSTNVSSSQAFERKAQQQLEILNDSTTNYAIFNCLYPMIAFDVVLRPARSHKLLARQLATITNFNPAPTSITYCELIRICMIGLIDSDGTPSKVNWAFFTFLKMPKLLLELSKLFTKPSSQKEPTSPLDYFASNQLTNFINDLKLAFERLCEYSPLLDEAEHKCNCDFFKCLIKELIKNDSSLIQLKGVEFRKFSTRRVNVAQDNSVGGHMMLKTEPVVTTMLQTFDSEQDPVDLFAILSQLVSGKQFEFTLSAAASTGRLQIFIRKLIEHNELNKVSKNESSKNPRIDALIFDITFLILTYIAQQYGPELIGQEQQTASTFGRWFYGSYNPATRINCPREMLNNADGEMVSSLIKQLLGPGIEMKSANWREVCFNIPAAISDIIKAWDQAQLSNDDIRQVIERIKSKMCFIAVVTATWLQSHIRTLNVSDCAKPIFFLHSLTKPSHHAKQTARQLTAKSNNNEDSSMEKYESYAERSSLMCSIVRKIYFELMPKSSNNSQSAISANLSTNNQLTNNNTSMISDQNMNMTLDTNPNNVVSLDSVSMEVDNQANQSTETEESLDESTYQSVNDRFLSTLTTQEIFLANVKHCLARGWIDHKSLINLNSLFKMIGSECFTNLIVEQILTSHESPSDLGRAVNITFGLFHLDIEACALALLKDTIPSWLMGEKKQALLNQPRAFALAHLTVITILEVYNYLKSLSAPGLKRLDECIANLMRLFKEIVSDPIMCQRTLFPILFLQQTVLCSRENSGIITMHLQPDILLDIINLFSSELTFELVLAISNLSTTDSRKYAAKAMCQLAKINELKQE